MKLPKRVKVDPDKCGGQPCIRGMLAKGVPHEETLRDFPYLEADDIKAALAYAAPNRARAS